jgi:CRP/FNR family transcriptional regulator
VASFLLTMADRLRGKGAGMEIPMTRGDMADYLGLTIETVSRTLTKMRQDGLIAIPSPTQIEISDRNRLEVLAAGEGDCFI